MVRQVVAWDCRKTLNVVVVMLRVKKCPAALATVLSSVGMYGEVAISGLRNAWARICARVVAKGQYAPKFCTLAYVLIIFNVHLCILYIVRFAHSCIM